MAATLTAWTRRLRGLRPLREADEEEGRATEATPRRRRVVVSDESVADGSVARGGRWVRRKMVAGMENGEGYMEEGNALCNQKYSFGSFLPLVLYEQFRMFYNMFFLMVATSQTIPALRVGFFMTYFGPLVFVVMISVAKEASDDLARWRRDKKMNLFAYTLLVRGEDGMGVPVRVASQDIRVGDLLVLETNERVPADCVLLRANATGDGAGDGQEAAGGGGEDGSIFIRTDQLDGETDWKLRQAVTITQRLESEDELLVSGAMVDAEAPKQEIYDFVGVLGMRNNKLGEDMREGLNLENTLWANTVVASGRAVCVVVYNGRETRSVMNASSPRSKIGKLDHEINSISKMLFALLFSLSATLTALRGFNGQWILYFFRYFLLLSAIIPISMRVNLDMAKIAYSLVMENDSARMPGCTVRNSNLPEELGRVEYLLTDKTGTLTQNDMAFKKLHLGNVLFARDSLEDVRSYASTAFCAPAALAANVGASSAPLRDMDAIGSPSLLPGSGVAAAGFTSPLMGSRNSSRREDIPASPAIAGSRRVHTQVRDALLAIALAHNVTPVDDGGQRTYQAASPDEVALVKFAESVGIVLAARTMSRVILTVPGGEQLHFEILAEFPFTSEAKRMGIIVQDVGTGTVTLYLKGADTVMSRRVNYNDWLDEECGNLAREGLRTLVFAKRELSRTEYARFAERWTAARTSQVGRKEELAVVQNEIEANMTLLALTGVEDKLQHNVRETLEKLRHAGVRVWMLTGDKVETATCIAVSSRLAERSQGIFAITGITNRNDAARALSRFRRQAATDVLVVDGTSLQVYLDIFPAEFVDAASLAPAAVACRCSPTQKAAVVRLLQEYKGKRVAAIGDGGNDVSMIQQANVGIGIPGKEGMQASMAADFSITSFAHLTRLMLWHGRNSYKRSARLAQFVMHRGLIISIIQTVYCALFFYAAVSVYSGWILVGYATVFTMFPVFSLIFDEDVSEQAAETYPELYKDLQKGRSLNLKTFLIWVFKSIYQGTSVMVFSVYVLWDDEYFTTLHLSAISFSALILTELLMVAVEVHVWHWMMVAAQTCSIAFYLASIVVLQDTFDHALMLQWNFIGRVLAVTLVSCLPVTIGKWLKRKIAPAPYSKIV
jgi:phospholipid-translocating ATPase